MPQVRTWFSDDDVTQCNVSPRLYFEPGRSRLMLEDGFFDFSNMRDRAYAMAWCQSNGVEFFDHRPELLPPELRERVRYARARGCGELRELKSRWRLVPLGAGAKLFVPQFTQIPSWTRARNEPPLPATIAKPAKPRFWNGTQLHTFTCPCKECLRSRQRERTAFADSTR